MSLKNTRTTTSYLPFHIAQNLIALLERDKDFKLAMFVAVGIYTGLRGSDILSLKWKDIIDKPELVKVEKKTGKRRVIRLNKQFTDVAERLHDCLGVIDLEQHIFINRYGSKTIRLQYVNCRLKDALKRHKLESFTSGNVSSHMLRKSLGRQVMEKNDYSEKALIMLSEIFNHSSPALTRRYLGITDAELANVYELL